MSIEHDQNLPETELEAVAGGAAVPLTGYRPRIRESKPRIGLPGAGIPVCILRTQGTGSK